MDSPATSSSSEQSAGLPVKTKRSAKKRKSTNVLEHYEEIKDEKGSKVGMKCLVPECGTILTYEATFNLERHITGKHPKLAVELGLTKDCQRKRQKIVVYVDPQEFLRHCVELITVDHLPINIFAKKSFRGLIDPVATKLSIPALTPPNVLLLCVSVEKIFINLIKAEVGGKFVCLKLDLATRHGRSMIGVNIQMIINGKIIIRTLGLVETTDRHTARYIEKEILQLLEKFSLKITQLYSTTTDSGSNVLKFVRLMINGQELEFHQNAPDEVATIATPVEDDISSDEIPEDIDELLVVELDSILRSVKCGAHTINLVVAEAIARDDISATIEEVRNLVKILRTEPHKQNFKLNHRRLPFLDCTTRWGFTYLMMNCLIENQEFIIEILPDNHNQNFDSAFWENCHTICDILKPIYVVTKKVQDHAIVYGDFFIMWKELSLEMQEIDHELARALLTAMNRRESGCFGNDAFWAAAILDRRINYSGTPFLSEDQQKSGMEHLIKTWKVLTAMKRVDETECSSEVPTTSSQQSAKISRLEQMLQRNAQPKSLASCDDIIVQLRKFSVLERLPLDADILQWWEENKHDYPDLHRLATVALAVPCTQVSVERAFSGFGQVLTPARTRLGKQRLEMILFIKLNSELFDTYEVNIPEFTADKH